MSQAKVVCMSIAAPLVERMDQARGDIPRSRWVSRLVEKELEKGEK